MRIGESRARELGRRGDGVGSEGSEGDGGRNKHGFQCKSMTFSLRTKTIMQELRNCNAGCCCFFV